MSGRSSSSSSGGAGLFTIVGTVFVVLKLLKVQPVAHWPWLWVLAPFWIGLAIGLAVILIVLLLIGLLDR